MGNKAQKLYSWFISFVWDDDLRHLGMLHGALIFTLRMLHMLIRELMGGQLNLRAMSLVYTTLLSVVPLLAVSFSVLKGFGYQAKFEPFLYEFLEPLGEKGLELADKVIGFVGNVKVGVLGSVGLGLLVYTVIALLQKIEAAFNFVWQVDRLRSFSQRFSNYLSVILIGPVLVVSALGITAATLNSDIARSLMAVEPLGSFVVYSSRLLPYFMVGFAFTLVYMFIPNTRVQFRAAIIGGFIAGALWQTTGWGFAAFIASSTRYAAIYSSFAILILLLIWLYLSWLILLVGSQIAFFVQYPKYMTLKKVSFVLSNRLRERLSLELMYLVGYNHYHNMKPWSLDEFVEHLGLPDEPVHRVIDILVDGGFLIEISNDDPSIYLPVHDIETIYLQELLDIVRMAGESPFLNEGQIKTGEPVCRLMDQLGKGFSNVTRGQTLKDLVQAGVDDHQEAATESP